MERMASHENLVTSVVEITPLFAANVEPGDIIVTSVEEEIISQTNVRRVAKMCTISNQQIALLRMTKKLITYLV